MDLDRIIMVARERDQLRAMCNRFVKYNGKLLHAIAKARVLLESGAADEASSMLRLALMADDQAEELLEHAARLLQASRERDALREERDRYWVALKEIAARASQWGEDCSWRLAMTATASSDEHRTRTAIALEADDRAAQKHE